MLWRAICRKAIHNTKGKPVSFKEQAVSSLRWIMIHHFRKMSYYSVSSSWTIPSRSKMSLFAKIGYYLFSWVFPKNPKKIFKRRTERFLTGFRLKVLKMPSSYFLGSYIFGLLSTQNIISLEFLYIAHLRNTLVGLYLPVLFDGR